ncbi:MAG: hypothetical protein H6Q19_768 [Bacteroidetes bacterium]|nr:hypothetical protein [Bacteroidota bacterium]
MLQRSKKLSGNRNSLEYQVCENKMTGGYKKKFIFCPDASALSLN